MPRFDDDVTLDAHTAGTFGFTAVSLDDLEASGYTLATICCDRSSSTQGFQDSMEAALKASVESLKKHPNSESIMLRVVTFDTEREEQHGFIPLANIDVDRYDGMLAPQGMTALFDACIDAAEAEAGYGKQLLADRFNVNGIEIVITDGMNNSGRHNRPEDVGAVAKAFKDTLQKECLESFSSVLIGVNLQDGQVQQVLTAFHDDAGFTADMISLSDATPETIARIGEFVTDSVSSTSEALGTGGPSQNLNW